jgi:hypothetical protein
MEITKESHPKSYSSSVDTKKNGRLFLTPTPSSSASALFSTPAMSDDLGMTLAHYREISHLVLSFSATTMPTSVIPMVLGVWNYQKIIGNKHKINALMRVHMCISRGTSVILPVMTMMVMLMVRLGTCQSRQESQSENRWGGAVGSDRAMFALMIVKPMFMLEVAFLV